METDRILRMVYDKEGYVSKMLLEAVMWGRLLPFWFPWSF
jgi:hypothetical protein